MENQDILIDTSIIIDHLRKVDKSRSLLFMLADNIIVNISTVTIFELFAGATNERKIHDIEIIMKMCRHVSFDMKVARQAAAVYLALKGDNQLIEIRDIFIAATALVYNLPVLTLNRKHFERIAGINLIDPETLITVPDN